MSRGDELLVTSKPQLPQWQLPRESTGYQTMIGWHVASGRGVEDGVPAEVAQVLLRAFTKVGWVSFFDAAERGASADTQVVCLEPGIGGRLRASLASLPRTVFLVSTRRWDVAVSAFDAEMFSWSLQGQALLVSGVDVSRPRVAWDEMMLITGRESTITAEMLGSMKVDAIVFPGVDGDVAGLLSVDAHVEAHILQELRAEGEAAGFAWRDLPEDEFAEAL
jgi:hypothetical protein